MTAPLHQVPAGWAPDVSAFGAQWAALPEEVRAAAASWAARTLWALSGRRFGTSELVVAPFIPPPRGTYYDSTYRGLTGRGYAVTTAGVSGGLGACGSARAFRLPWGPVVDVAVVVLDGQVLAEDAWHLDPDGTLVRMDGGGWPVGQDVYAPRWTVQYTRGQEAPPDANLAAGRYAMELARALTQDAACRLPSRTRDVARQGISVGLAAPEDLADAGLTGVTLVDHWLRSANPGQLQQAPSFWSPGSTRHRVLDVL